MPTPINNNNVIDLSLASPIKTFRFGQDDSRVVQVNTSDFNFLSRLSEAYPKLNELQKKVAVVTDGISSDSGNTDEDIKSLGVVGARFAEIDTEMRGLIDYIFGAPVSAAAVPTGTMYDLCDGEFMFNLVITVMLSQFEDNYKKEFAKLKTKLSKHTGKYVNKR